MTAPPEHLRDLARRVDVRKPILPPPDLAPALLAAADELERQQGKIAGLAADVARIRQTAAERATEMEALVTSMAEHRRIVRSLGDKARHHEAETARARGDVAERVQEVEALRDEAEGHAAAVERMRQQADAMLADMARLRPVIEAAAALRAALGAT